MPTIIPRFQRCGAPLAAHPLLDLLREKYNHPNDQSLANMLHCSLSTISQMRTGKRTITANMVLSIYDLGEWEIERIRKLAGVGEHGELRSTNEERKAARKSKKGQCAMR
jgi:hypothetical protein